MTMDIQEILSYLPHRYPFLLVDRVLEFHEWQSLVGIKNVTVNEPFFPGHFPGQPVMPGVLMLEALAQAAGIVVLKSDPTLTNDKNLFLLVGIDNVRFKRMVIPGDQLRLSVSLLKHKGGIFKFNCEASVDGEVACNAEIMVARRAK